MVIKISAANDLACLAEVMIQGHQTDLLSDERIPTT